MKPLTLGIFY